jgi:hypothetical protein
LFVCDGNTFLTEASLPTLPPLPLTTTTLNPVMDQVRKPSTHAIDKSSDFIPYLKAAFHALMKNRTALLSAHCPTAPGRVPDSARLQMLHVQVLVLGPSDPGSDPGSEPGSDPGSDLLAKAAGLVWCPVFKSASSSWTAHVVLLSGAGSQRVMILLLIILLHLLLRIRLLLLPLEGGGPGAPEAGAADGGGPVPRPPAEGRRAGRRQDARGQASLPQVQLQLHSQVCTGACSPGRSFPFLIYSHSYS